MCSTSTISVTDRKSTRLNSSHTEIYTLSLHDALPISTHVVALATVQGKMLDLIHQQVTEIVDVQHIHDFCDRSEEHTSELQSHRDLHSFPTRRSSDLHPRCSTGHCTGQNAGSDPPASHRNRRCAAHPRFL